MELKAFIFITFCCLDFTIDSLTIYKSNTESYDANMTLGLTFKKKDNQLNFVSNSFTVCMRTNIKRLAEDESAMLLLIGYSKDVNFLRLYARYPASYITLSWIIHKVIRDPYLKEYLIWKIDLWNHVCFSYSETNSYISFVKVSYV